MTANDKQEVRADLNALHALVRDIERDSVTQPEPMGTRLRKYARDIQMLANRIAFRVPQ